MWNCSQLLPVIASRLFLRLQAVNGISSQTNVIGTCVVYLAAGYHMHAIHAYSLAQQQMIPTSLEDALPFHLWACRLHNCYLLCNDLLSTLVVQVDRLEVLEWPGEHCKVSGRQAPFLGLAPGEVARHMINLRMGKSAHLLSLH